MVEVMLVAVSDLFLVVVPVLVLLEAEEVTVAILAPYPEDSWVASSAELMATPREPTLQLVLVLELLPVMEA